MKKWATPVITMAALAGAIAFGPRAQAADPNAESILGGAESVLNRSGGYEYLLRMEVRQNDRVELSFAMKMLQKGRDKSLIVFVSPPAMKDQKILRNGEEQWIYFPRLGRSMNVSKLQSLGGSDFSYADILNLDLSRDFEPVLQQKSQDPSQYHLVLTAKSAKSVYSRVDYFIRRDDLAPLRRDYFTKSGKILKTLTFSEYDDNKTPRTWRMASRLQANRVTIMHIEAVQQRDDLKDEDFSLTALGRRN